MQYLETRIVSREEPAPGYALLAFTGDGPIAGEPGQFVMVRGDWGAHPTLGRAFSLVESGERGAILIRVVGEGTRLLAALDPGDRLFVLGPAGHGFDLPSAGERPVLVAGGVGVAPLIFLAERAAARGVRPRFLYGARTSADLPLADRVAAAADLAVTTEDGSAGERGLVTSPLARLLEAGEGGPICSCGPEAMLEAVAKLAVEHGVPCQVALESPMACGMGTCKGCAVLAADREYRYVCSDGPVFEASQIWDGGDRWARISV
jgi:dihydroorotate dehydrogenase electron transfer subunit